MLLTGDNPKGAANPLDKSPVTRINIGRAINNREHKLIWRPLSVNCIIAAILLLLPSPFTIPSFPDQCVFSFFTHPPTHSVTLLSRVHIYIKRIHCGGGGVTHLSPRLGFLAVNWMVTGIWQWVVEAADTQTDIKLPAHD